MAKQSKERAGARPKYGGSNCLSVSTCPNTDTTAAGEASDPWRTPEAGPQQTEMTSEGQAGVGKRLRELDGRGSGRHVTHDTSIQRAGEDGCQRGPTLVWFARNAPQGRGERMEW
jgi:hypothetical protein